MSRTVNINIDGLAVNPDASDEASLSEEKHKMKNMVVLNDVEVLCDVDWCEEVDEKTDGEEFVDAKLIAPCGSGRSATTDEKFVAMAKVHVVRGEKIF